MCHTPSRGSSRGGRTCPRRRPAPRGVIINTKSIPKPVTFIVMGFQKLLIVE